MKAVASTEGWKKNWYQQEELSLCFLLKTANMNLGRQQSSSHELFAAFTLHRGELDSSNWDT